MTRGIRYLQEALEKGNLIPVVGAGYGAAEASLPSWQGVLTAGIDYLKSGKAQHVSSRRIQPLIALAKSGDLPTAFNYLQGLLGEEGRPHYESIHYQGFLNEIFHQPVVRSTRLSEALRALAPRVVLTTNYDLLLEEAGVPADGRAVTWGDPAGIRSLLRSGTGVIHLHGRYDVPSSVILSATDYQRIVDDDDSIAISQALFHSGILLFICSSVQGVEDPHLGRILSEFARITDRLGPEESPHVALFPGRLSGTEIARLRRLGIEAVSYGADYSALPAFIEEIAGKKSITMEAFRARALLTSVIQAASLGDALGHVADFIRHEVFSERDVRVTFCERVDLGVRGVQLEARHVLPLNATHNIFNYPLSIAAWALVEGRMVSWPEERSVRCDLNLVERLGRFARVRELLTSENVAAFPEIVKYLDLGNVRRRFDDRTLTLGVFFQDWSADQPDPRYDRFLCVPVPVVESFGNRQDISQHGVFNIDTRGGVSLLDRRTGELLKFASALAVLAFDKHGGRSHPVVQ